MSHQFDEMDVLADMAEKADQAAHAARRATVVAVAKSEFNAAGGKPVLGVSLEQYIATRLVDEGLETLSSAAPPQKPAAVNPLASGLAEPAKIS
jgi:hypothetical protein